MNSPSSTTVVPPFVCRYCGQTRNAILAPGNTVDIHRCQGCGWPRVPADGGVRYRFQYVCRCPPDIGVPVPSRFDMANNRFLAGPRGPCPAATGVAGPPSQYGSFGNGYPVGHQRHQQQQQPIKHFDSCPMRGCLPPGMRTQHLPWMSNGQGTGDVYSSGARALGVGSPSPNTHTPINQQVRPMHQQQAGPSGFGPRFSPQQPPPLLSLAGPPGLNYRFPSQQLPTPSSLAGPSRPIAIDLMATRPQYPGAMKLPSSTNSSIPGPSHGPNPGFADLQPLAPATVRLSGLGPPILKQKRQIETPKDALNPSAPEFVPSTTRSPPVPEHSRNDSGIAMNTKTTAPAASGEDVPRLFPPSINSHDTANGESTDNMPSSNSNLEKSAKPATSELATSPKVNPEIWGPDIAGDDDTRSNSQSENDLEAKLPAKFRTIHTSSAPASTGEPESEDEKEEKQTHEEVWKEFEGRYASQPERKAEEATVKPEKSKINGKERDPATEDVEEARMPEESNMARKGDGRAVGGDREDGYGNGTGLPADR